MFYGKGLLQEPPIEHPEDSTNPTVYFETRRLWCRHHGTYLYSPLSRSLLTTFFLRMLTRYQIAACSFTLYHVPGRVITAFWRLLRIHAPRRSHARRIFTIRGLLRGINGRSHARLRPSS